MNRQQLAERLREHAELHGGLNDGEQRQWADDLRTAADIVDRCECAPELKMPDGCQCDPREWDLEINPICAAFQGDYGKPCRRCEHDEICHKEANYEADLHHAEDAEKEYRAV